MKNKSVALIIVVFVLLVIITLLIINNKQKIKKIEGIRIFTFSYSTGRAIDSNVQYKLECTDKCIINIKPKGHLDEKIQVKEVNLDFVKQLEELLNNYQVFKWNGFKKYDKNVLDGNSFHLYIRLESEKTIEADGYMRYPHNYKIVRDKIDKLFMSYWEDKNE